jgi:hypothetical protein
MLLKVISVRSNRKRRDLYTIVVEGAYVKRSCSECRRQLDAAGNRAAQLLGVLNNPSFAEEDKIGWIKNKLKDWDTAALEAMAREKDPGFFKLFNLAGKELPSGELIGVLSTMDGAALFGYFEYRRITEGIDVAGALLSEITEPSTVEEFFVELEEDREKAEELRNLYLDKLFVLGKSDVDSDEESAARLDLAEDSDASSFEYHS